MVKGFIASLAILGGMMIGVAHATPAAPSSVQFLITQLLGLSAPELTVEASSYPQALPNDGHSEAVISVVVEREGKPVADVEVQADVVRGDGVLRSQTCTTDSEGVARFGYRAGFATEPGIIAITSADESIEAEVKLPLAPMAYLDVELVTPEEYAKFRQRQASAAPIYTLDVSAFPEQLAADGGSLSSITAILTHVDGKPAPGVPLQASVVSGDGSVLSQQKATDAAGRFTLYFTAGRTPGPSAVRIVEPSTGLTRTVNILLVEAGPARVQLLYHDPAGTGPSREGALLPCDGITELPMLARVTDLSGRPLAGVELRVEIVDAGTGRIDLLHPVSNALGEVDFSYIAGTLTGKVRLRAYAAAGMEAAP